ncbi:MAG: hypothetical protein CME65_08010 [Halobacteriovoraceae bacterium]|nr:hypothetical protein [Halobacteriovoraceae bacterium]|tara:strand:+ start:5815 stop:7059 length:1245 start_codon:yes stop_codon:yes gene_type:complete
MNIDLIIVGNELLNGKIEDRNTHYLACELYNQGHKLRKVHIIGDDEKLYFEALDAAFSHSEVVITTGGLGPTQDDLTKDILGKYFKCTSECSEEALEMTLSHFKRGNREYDQDKFPYHYLPRGFKAIFNPAGYAPGLHFTDGRKTVFATPGVPTEFQAMLKEEIFPKLSKNSNEIIKHIIVKTWKVPESKIFFELAPKLWDELSPLGEVSSLPHLVGVDIGVKLIESSQAQISKKEEKIIELIKATPLKDYIWHIGTETMEELIIREASEKNLTIGCAESCTGGLVASKLTDISGSSAVFWGSVVSYANEVKMKSLGVGEETLKNYGAVSEQTALEMAIGAREHLGVDITVTTTGIAGPGGGSKEKPVGTVGIGISTSKESKSKIYHFSGTRKSLKERFARVALMKLLEAIREA